MTSSFRGTYRLTKEFQTSSSPTIDSPRLPAKLLQQLHYHKQYPINSLPEPSRFWKRCKKAKEEGLENKCTEVENPSHNAKHMYKKIKENGGGTTAPPSKYIKAADGRILHEQEDNSACWEEYIQELFNEDQAQETFVTDFIESGPPNMKSEIEWAQQKMKPGKAAGPDEIYVEMLKALDEDGIHIIWELANTVCETRKFPEDMLQSIFVALPKIPGTLDCSSHRTISLMSHILKIILNVILQRIRSQSQWKNSRQAYQRGSAEDFP